MEASPFVEQHSGVIGMSRKIGPVRVGVRHRARCSDRVRDEVRKEAASNGDQGKIQT